MVRIKITSLKVVRGAVDGVDGLASVDKVEIVERNFIASSCHNRLDNFDLQNTEFGIYV